MGGLIDIEQKGCESVILDQRHDLLVAKGRCEDLLGSDQDDFKCQCAIDTSSLYHSPILYM